MSAMIQLHQVITLASIHLLIGIILYGVGHALLPKIYCLTWGFTLASIWGWSLIALVVFYLRDDGFIAWLFNPSGEANLAALLNSTLLILIACSSISLLWADLQNRRYGLALYWLLVSILFIFLAIDEYFSIHEEIVFWRGGYLILGGIVGLLSLMVMLWSKVYPRTLILTFIIGLGIMGVSGVVLDAFSTENLLDIGPIKFTFLRCRGMFLGVNCREFGNTEEMMELFGAAMMCFGLVALTGTIWSKRELQLQRRFIYTIAFGWLLILIFWMWGAPSIQARLAIPATTHYGDISILGYDINTHQIQAGDRLDVTVYVKLQRTTRSTYSMSVHLYTRDTDAPQSMAQDDMQLGEFIYPSRAWLPHLTVRNRFHLDIPEDLPTNQSYQLVVIVWEKTIQDRIPVQSSILTVYSDGTTLVIDGIAAPSSETAPTTHAISYSFADGFALEGVRLPNDAVIGEDVTLDFWWHSQRDLDIAATQYLHWFNVETGEYFIFDQIPFGGFFPTQDWVEGMRVLDSWTISLPDEMPAGTYRVLTGMYRTNDGERLTVTDMTGTSVQDNSIELGRVTVR